MNYVINSIAWTFQAHTKTLKPQEKPRRDYRVKLNALFFLSVFIINPLFAINLFDEQRYKPLIADRKASFPGDVLTVIVLETSNAQTSADLSSNKEIKTALEAGYNRNQYEVDFGLKGKGNAGAKTGRNGKIKAALTVRIKEVLPNDTYRVEGVQIITINHEQQRILLRGIVRPEDISSQNTILSTRLAQAEIVYTGAGSVSNAQDHNYLYKILSFVGLV